MELFVNCSNDFSITDNNGKEYAINQAREIVERPGSVTGCNIAFERLVSLNWDMSALQQFYADNQ